MDTSKNINKSISDAVNYLMKHHAPKAFSQAGLAKASGVSQAMLSVNLRGCGGWSIDVLERLCPPLGVSLEDLITIGRELQKGGRVFPWPSLLRDTAPGSDERLRVLISAAAGESTQLARLVNPQSVRETAAAEYKAYRAGELTDGDMFLVLRKSFGYVESDIKFISQNDEESVGIFYDKMQGGE